MPFRLVEVGSHEYHVGKKWKELDQIEASKQKAVEVRSSSLRGFGVACPLRH